MILVSNRILLTFDLCTQCATASSANKAALCTYPSVASQNRDILHTFCGSSLSSSVSLLLSLNGAVLFPTGTIYACWRGCSCLCTRTCPMVGRAICGRMNVGVDFMHDCAIIPSTTFTNTCSNTDMMILQQDLPTFCEHMCKN